jgi:hypothetical protein
MYAFILVSSHWLALKSQGSRSHTRDRPEAWEGVRQPSALDSRDQGKASASVGLVECQRLHHRICLPHPYVIGVLGHIPQGRDLPVLCGGGASLV